MAIVSFIYDYEEYVDLGNGVAKSKKPDASFTIELNRQPTIDEINTVYLSWLEHIEHHAKLKEK
jgi:hypothetical protein